MSFERECYVVCRPRVLQPKAKTRQRGVFRGGSKADSSACTLSRRRQMAGVIVATPGWALPRRDGLSTQGPWGALAPGVVLFHPSSLAGGGRPRLLKSNADPMCSIGMA